MEDAGVLILIFVFFRFKLLQTSSRGMVYTCIYLVNIISNFLFFFLQIVLDALTFRCPLLSPVATRWPSLSQQTADTKYKLASSSSEATFIFLQILDSTSQMYVVCSKATAILLDCPQSRTLVSVWTKSTYLQNV